MWKCPKCETNNEGDFCIICSAAKPAPENPSSAGKPFYIPTFDGSYAAAKPADTPAKPAFAEVEEDAADEFVPDLIGKIRSAKIFVMLCTAFAVILMAIPYLGSYSIFSLLGGNVPSGAADFKGIVIVVSYVLLAATLLPSIFIWINFNVLQRFLPVTISIVSFCVSTLYCLTLGIGLIQNNQPLGGSVFIWISPFLMGAIALLCAGILKWQKRIDNILYKPRMAPDKPVRPAENPAPPTPPPAAPAPEINEPRLKSTMRTKHNDMPKGE